MSFRFNPCEPCCCSIKPWNFEAATYYPDSTFQASGAPSSGVTYLASGGWVFQTVFSESKLLKPNKVRFFPDPDEVIGAQVEIRTDDEFTIIPSGEDGERAIVRFSNTPDCSTPSGEARIQYAELTQDLCRPGCRNVAVYVKSKNLEYHSPQFDGVDVVISSSGEFIPEVAEIVGGISTHSTPDCSTYDSTSVYRGVQRSQYLRKVENKNVNKYPRFGKSHFGISFLGSTSDERYSKNLNHEIEVWFPPCCDQPCCQEPSSTGVDQHLGNTIWAAADDWVGCVQLTRNFNISHPNGINSGVYLGCGWEGEGFIYQGNPSPAQHYSKVILLDCQATGVVWYDSPTSSGYKEVQSVSYTTGYRLLATHKTYEEYLATSGYGPVDGPISQSNSLPANCANPVFNSVDGKTWRISNTECEIPPSSGDGDDTNNCQLGDLCFVFPETLTAELTNVFGCSDANSTITLNALIPEEHYSPTIPPPPSGIFCDPLFFEEYTVLCSGGLHRYDNFNLGLKSALWSSRIGWDCCAGQADGDCEIKYLELDDLPLVPCKQTTYRWHDTDFVCADELVTTCQPLEQVYFGTTTINGHELSIQARLYQYIQISQSGKYFGECKLPSFDCLESGVIPPPGSGEYCQISVERFSQTAVKGISIDYIQFLDKVDVSSRLLSTNGLTTPDARKTYFYSNGIGVDIQSQNDFEESVSSSYTKTTVTEIDAFGSGIVSESYEGGSPYTCSVFSSLSPTWRMSQFVPSYYTGPVYGVSGQIATNDPSEMDDFGVHVRSICTDKPCYNSDVDAEYIPNENIGSLSRCRERFGIFISE